MSTEYSELEISVCTYLYNLEAGMEVKESLEKLESMEIPAEMLRQHKVMEVARRFLITEGVKNEARKLLAKVRRIEGSPASGSSSDEGQQKSLKRQRESTPEDEMLTSKRTAPVKYVGKKRTSEENVTPSEMNLSQLRAHISANPTEAAVIDELFKKFVFRDFPSAARYPKPAHLSWQEHYEKFASLCKKDIGENDLEEVKQAELQLKEKREKQVEQEKAQKKAEQDAKFQKFLEKKKASMGASKKVQKPVLLPVDTLSVRDQYRQKRLDEAKLAKETGKWPVAPQPVKPVRNGRRK